MMRKKILRHLAAATVATLALAASAETLFGVGATGSLVKFDTSQPGAVLTVVATNFLPESSITFGPDGFLYGFDLSSRVQRLDLATGERRLISGLFAPTGDITFGPDGRLYGLTSANTILSLDIASQQTTLVASNIAARGDLRFGPDGKLYTTDTAFDLVRLTRAGQAWTRQSIERHMGTSGGLTFAPDGSLYAIDDRSLLITFNPRTGFLDRLNFSVQWGSGDLQFGSDGLIYGFDLNGRVQRMNLTTGARSILASGMTGNADLAFQPSAPVPEPASGLLLLLGLPAVAWRHLRRSKADAGSADALTTDRRRNTQR